MNTLGRGLESLIPPRDENSNQPAVPPQDDSVAVFPSDYAQDDSAAHITLEKEPEERETEREMKNDTSAPPHVFAKKNVRANAPLRKKHAEDLAVFYIETEKIVPNREQPRRHFDEESLRELAASIREFGILQPIVVRKIEHEVSMGTQVEYELIAGERRLMAAKMLGLERIPAIVKNVELERERLEIAVIENIQREDLNAIEMARAFARLQDEFRMTQREIAARLGKSRETIANTLRLLDLPSDIRQALEEKKISESHGRLLLTINDPGIQIKIFHDILAMPMTTRELRNRVRAATHSDKKDEEGDEPRGDSSGLSPELFMLQEQLSSELGAPVKIHKNGDSGKITISFYSQEELTHIMQRLGREENDSPSL